MTKTLATLRADWGPPLQAAAHRLAPLLAAAYAAGWWLGHQIHSANDWLAARRRM